jgi:hypothetical protein
MRKESVASSCASVVSIASEVSQRMDSYPPLPREMVVVRGREVLKISVSNFYHAFIPKFSDIARPLNDLMKKNYQWR